MPSFPSSLSLSLEFSFAPSYSSFFLPSFTLMLLRPLPALISPTLARCSSYGRLSSETNPHYRRKSIPAPYLSLNCRQMGTQEIKVCGVFSLYVVIIRDSVSVLVMWRAPPPYTSTTSTSKTTILTVTAMHHTLHPSPPSSSPLTCSRGSFTASRTGNIHRSSLLAVYKQNLDSTRHFPYSTFFFAPPFFFKEGKLKSGRHAQPHYV